jgi:hypothetical protein
MVIKLSTGDDVKIQSPTAAFATMNIPLSPQNGIYWSSKDQEALIKFSHILPIDVALKAIRANKDALRRALVLLKDHRLYVSKLSPHLTKK